MIEPTEPSSRRLGRSGRSATSIFCLLALSCSLTARIANAQPEASVYETKIKPFLRERCFGCHGSLKQEGGLRLDTVELMRVGGDSGEAILPGEDAADSLLLERVADADPSTRMPPEHEGEAFTPAQIEMFREWIASGAIGVADEEPEKDPSEHWSFLPIVRPEIPRQHENGSTSGIDTHASWAKNPIDHWIAKGHSEQGLAPQPEASRAILLRRLTLDLIGILPTAQETAAFEQDTAHDWYEKAVERLLSDPRHGERWARHWMDNWRYSDWWGLGEEHRNSQRHLWHWRDWMIESLNQDTPYDQMVRSMFAGDEIYPGDVDSLRATGYLARNFFIFNRNQWMDETVEHVSKAFLGLTMNCAKCHDHKFDPITQVDYYKMRAFFEPYHVRVDLLPGETDPLKMGLPRVFDGQIDAPTHLFIRGEESQADTTKSIPPGVPDLFNQAPLSITPVKLPAVSFEPERNEWVADSYIAKAQTHIQATEAEQETLRQQLRLAEEALQQIESETPPTLNATESFADSFYSLNESRWKKMGGNWSTPEDGQSGLRQTIDGPTTSELRYLSEAPANFDASLQFRILGGSQWRSIGIAFDVTDESGARSEHLIYVSGVDGHSKVQASYKVKGEAHYPADGAKHMPIDLHRDYALRVQVRDSLINVFLDGERVLAWRSPIGRQTGPLQLVTFDALASIQRFELAALDVNVGLLDPARNELVAGDRRREAEREVERKQADWLIASAKLNTHLAESLSVIARQRAFRAKWDAASNDTQKETHLAAVTAERRWDVSKANLQWLRAKETLRRATQEKQDDARKELDAAVQALEAAQSRFETQPELTDPLSPFIGAKWSATRFQSTLTDDPAIEFPQESTGRRKGLAEWITHPSNPLTPRVAVNHIWSRHLDQPLAANTFDMGRNAPDPANPELIDWLAAEFVESGWSMKHIHRLIVNSATYRMSSSIAGGEENAIKDPDNRYWWRRTPIRLESQAIRDSILSLANQLDPTIGGPPVPPDEQANSTRRSLYFFHSNNERNLFLTMFDEALVAECYRREQSIVPQQALALSNSELVLKTSEAIAQAFTIDAHSDAEFIRHAFKTVLGIDASEEELKLSLEAMREWEQMPGASPEDARSHLVWSLLNHNDFVTLR